MKTFLTTTRKLNLRYGAVMLFYVLASVIVSVALVLNNRLIGDMSESALVADVSALVWFLALATGITAVRAIFSAMSTLVLARFSAAAGYQLRQYFVSHFLRLPFAQFEKAGSGESLSVFSNDLPEAEQFIATRILSFVSDFASFVAAFVFMLVISPLFTGVLMLAAVVLLALQILVAMPIQKRAGFASEKAADFNAVVNDSLQNLSVVAAYSLDDVLEEHYLTAYTTYFEATKRVLKALVPTVLVAFVSMLTPLAVVYTVLALSVINGNMTLAEFIAFVATITYAAGGLMQVGQGIGHLVRSSANAKRFVDSTADAPEDVQTGEALAEATAASISFKNVSFSYSEEAQPAVSGVSFDIAPGSKVAIIGGSGSGKSTVLKLLMGLYEPGSGSITINGQDITQLSKASIRSAFAYVPQDAFLFPESIGRNITLEDTITDMPRLEKACRDAGILEFIQQLPEGFDSVLTEASDNISGGQRQRIAMARAFYKDAPVILFDEATSSLDPDTEAGILDSLSCATAGKTVVMVAHRERAIVVCDAVVRMEGRGALPHTPQAFEKA